MRLIGTDQNGLVLNNSLPSRNESGCEVVVEVDDDLEVYPDCTVISGNSANIVDQEKFDEHRAGKWNEIRLIRNNVIATTDWTQLGDAALTAEEVTAWQTYRTELRDMIDEDSNPFSVVWPTKPS